MFTSIIPKTPSQKQHPRLWPLIGGAALLPTAWQGVEDHRAKDVDGNTLREEIMGPFIFPHAYQSMLVPQRFPKLRAMYQSRVVTIANPGVLLICKTALRRIHPTLQGCGVLLIFGKHTALSLIRHFLHEVPDKGTFGFPKIICGKIHRQIVLDECFLHILPSFDANKKS